MRSIDKRLRSKMIILSVLVSEESRELVTVTHHNDSLDTTIDYRCSRGGSALVGTKIAANHVWDRVTSDVSSESRSLDTRHTRRIGE
ncbi:hypothetical protein J6590_018699 [Homalodisca vitripennis]|nr:hypothetical protein J6590_018699 [Homalodisca vitripennis]